MEPLPPVSWVTRLLINLLRHRSDVLTLHLELLLPEDSVIPENINCYDDDELDELLADAAAADNIDTLNRIYKASGSGQR